MSVSVITDRYQEAVQRSESVRMMLSDFSWKKGLSNFFYQQVPWQYSTSQFLARRISRIIDIYFSGKTSIQLVEIGAGSGFLSKLLLDVLLRDYPAIYEKVSVLVTDSSSQLIEQYGQHDVFKVHADRIQFNVFSIHSPLDELGIQPDMVYFSNLIDATPTHHLTEKDGQLMDMLVQSDLPRSVLRDIGFDVDDLMKVKHLYLLGRDIVSRLNETYVPVSISDSAISYDHQVLLNRYVEDRNIGADLYFNVQPVMTDILLGWAKANPDLLIFSTDFGVSTSNVAIADIDKLISTYGMTSFSAVNFDYIYYVLQLQGVSMSVSKNEPGMPQSMLIGPQLDGVDDILADCSFTLFKCGLTLDSFLNTFETDADIMANLDQVAPYYMNLFQLCYHFWIKKRFR